MVFQAVEDGDNVKECTLTLYEIDEDSTGDYRCTVSYFDGRYILESTAVQASLISMF